MKWLHLTDLHFNPWQDGRSTNELKDMLIPYLRNHRITADYLFLTGDYRHAKYQCASIEDTARDAAQFILQIAEAAQIPASNIHIVPGNHDLNRTANTERLANIVAKYDVYDGRFETDDLIFLLERFPFFSCLREELNHKGATSCCPEAYLSAPHPYYCYDDFSLLCLNTCMVCNADKDRGALLVGNYYIWQALEAIKKIQSDKPIIILAHHALNLLREDERWEMEKLFVKYPVRLYLCGDSHVLRRRTINDLTEITSGCLIQGRDIQACFPVGTMANGSFSLEVHSWDAPMSNWGSYTHFNQKYMSNCTTSIVTNGQPVLPSPYFMGRDAKIEEIEEVILTGSKHVMLCGMGGIGKTEICRQLFQKYLYETDSDSISHLGWICYQSALKDSFVGHFPEINSTDMDGYWLSTEHFIQNLGPQLLLFIDNADSITQQELLMLEKLNCRIILTSRAKSDRIKTIDISSLSPEDCLALYRFHSMEDSNDNESIHTIISLVAYHTLFVELLAKIQYAAGLSAKELLQKLQQRKFDLSNIKENISYLHNPEINHDQKWSRQFMEHVNILFDISKVNDKPEELWILQLFSLLAPGIPVSVHIIKSWFMLKDLNAINSLAHKGWLERGSQNGIPSFTIHPLVSAAIRSTAKSPQELLVALTQTIPPVPI